jgi:hypothetical protein
MEQIMNHYEFRIAVAIVLISFVAHRGYYTRKMGQSNSSVVEKPELGKLSSLAGALALPAFLATVIYIFKPTWVSWSTLALPGWLRWSGAIVALGGFGLLQWAQN